ncbi:Protein of unknown function [Duganella sp. CF402]|uniref:DUF262 domain-containing protein n=1 Tax=unclassified Duganella TaxID=2636909 RepID=UPI0008B20A6C|nr:MULTISPECIES: DUF262 domain-containing protein [unclassified Duganella]RZT06301.1 uncharacterized protein DUF1524 [Duganella sp. BK701]SEM68472.1 Protein of unknown function [Duganella sp. CF402]
MTDKRIEAYSARAMLEDDADYVIPMYQRNYAWDEGEITQLIQDVKDYMPKPGEERRNYYIGSLVVFKREGTPRTIYETIDGQQRLTTLSLLASCLRRQDPARFAWFKRLNICFASRPKSASTFAAIFDGRFKRDPLELLDKDEVNTAILNGYRLMQKILPQLVGDEWHAFADYLFECVHIMRVEVPPDTDLNHYFEIMNSRGEQLEKHEVLKARMLAVLQDIHDPQERAQSQDCFQQIWDACADMEKYVQAAFKPELRGPLFGERDWGGFAHRDFGQLCQLLCRQEASTGTEMSLDAILAGTPPSERPKEKEEAPERFNAVINFPNFLLHVLSMTEPVSLDDKGLIAHFEKYVLKPENAIDKVKAFAFNLLKCKYLLDQYVIKREMSKDRWSLSRYKWRERAGSRHGQGDYEHTFAPEDINRQLLMLLSAFHVSTPTMMYKHWLNAALHYLFHADRVEAGAYLQHMESVAKAFVFDRFLAVGEGADYGDIIYEKKGKCQAQRGPELDGALEKILRFGAIRHNLVFNYLDFLLWRQHRTTDARVDGYYFTFRSSVEHFYPQQPKDGAAILDDQWLHSFGNLCLISHSKNSALSNFSPVAKKDYYANSIDSVKQHLMLQHAADWGKDRIQTHCQQMKQVLLNSL